MANYEHPPNEFTDLVEVGEAKAEKIKSAGYDSVEDLKELSEEEIAEIDGVGPAGAGMIASQLDEDTEWPVSGEREANLSEPEDDIKEFLGLVSVLRGPSQREWDKFEKRREENEPERIAVLEELDNET